MNIHDTHTYFYTHIRIYTHTRIGGETDKGKTVDLTPGFEA